MNASAVVLLSGGLDSATTLAIAKNAGLTCYCLSLDYGQRHSAELDAATRVAKALGAHEHRLMKVSLNDFGGSSLTDKNCTIPTEGNAQGIPNTYVPARNTLLLSLALGWAEVLQSKYIYLGVNAVDYSGYPDCRPEFVDAFQRLADVATKAAVEGRKTHIIAPLMHLSKAEIIAQGVALGVDYSLTVSCYQADETGRACGQCDSCRLRRNGFDAAGNVDPTRYVSAL